jgi:glycosyltransferase involved in cell wall biosynthesis
MLPGGSGVFFAQGPSARSWAARIGLDDGRLRTGRSSVDGLPAGPLPGLPSPRMTFAGRFRGDKAPDVLIEALALLDAPPPAYLIGDGPLGHALTCLVRDRGLGAAVRLPGWSFEPGRYIAGAGVHVVPCREESWSQSAVLAMGLGVPVVGTTVDGLARTLGEGRGILIPPEDPPALARALTRVLAGARPDPLRGQAYARQFTPAAAATVYAGAYRQLFASGTRAGNAGAPPL